MKFIIMFTLLFTPTLFAQEQTGHGRQHQQEQQHGGFKRVVIIGEEAEKLFKHYYAQAPAEDLSLKCSSPVKAVYGNEHSQLHSVCFDRGENFWSDRFKCYTYKYYKYQSRRRIEPIFFNWFHNSCGGDGIYPID